MQSFAIAATVATIASASASDFPRFDAMHANCAMAVTYQNWSCDTLQTMMDYEIRSWANGGPSGGLYAIYEESEGDHYIWSTRTTPVAKYVDDQIFQFTQDGSDCNVAAKSRSQTKSYYDYDTNYCNMWNVFTELGSFTNLSTSDCQWVPSDAVATCAIY